MKKKRVKENNREYKLNYVTTRCSFVHQRQKCTKYKLNVGLSLNAKCIGNR